MSILIRGMDMPVIELEWTIRRGADGKWYAIDTNAETSDGEWHEIVHVPPHGDLIERKTVYDSLLDGMVMTGYQSRALDCINEVYVPTIIPADLAEEGE